jgi:hypothetical protein
VKVGEKTPTQLGPLERANLNHGTNPGPWKTPLLTQISHASFRAFTFVFNWIPGIQSILPFFHIFDTCMCGTNFYHIFYCNFIPLSPWWNWLSGVYKVFSKDQGLSSDWD